MSIAFYDEILSFIKVHWPDAKSFFNSVFFTAIAGSLAGAFAGAWAAQKVANRTRNRDELLKEIRGTNAAIMVAFGIVNSLLSIKKQHIKSLKEKFDQHKSSTMQSLQKQQAGVGGPVTFLADFRTLPTVNVPMTLLQTQMFEKLSVHGRSILLANTLEQSIDALNVSIKKRNQLIEEFKGATLPDVQLLALYFGFPFNGRVNEEYSNTIQAIYAQTDDAIFYGVQLCKDLTRHGDTLSTSFDKQFRKGAPKIHKPDFSKAVEAGLLPNESDYADWMTMFVKRTE